MVMVKKCGSAANQADLFAIAESCAAEYRKGNDLVVVLSAMENHTEELIAQAKAINPNPSAREMDMLLSVGAQMSAAFLAMALETMEIPAVSLNAFQAKIHTTEVHGNAAITQIEPDRILAELEQKKIVIVTGAQGMDAQQNITTLGKAGADATAVALAAALQADVCELYTVAEEPDGQAAHTPCLYKKRKRQIA